MHGSVVGVTFNGERWKVKNLKAFWQLEIEHNKVLFGVEGERAVTQVKSHQGQKFHLLSSSGCGQCGHASCSVVGVVVCQELGRLIYFYAGRNGYCTL